MKKIKLNESFYLIIKKGFGSNYTQMVSVFKVGEKNPIFGTSFNNTKSIDDIKEWANKTIAYSF